MRKASASTSPTSIAAEWEEAMLLSCLSPTEDNRSCSGSDNNSTSDVNSYGYDYQTKDDDEEDCVGGLLQLSSESSFTSNTSFDSSDSDISLCRNTSRNRKKGPRQQKWGPLVSSTRHSNNIPVIHPTAAQETTDDYGDGGFMDDSDCSGAAAISAVSLANLFLGSSPCDLQLENDDEGVEVVQAELLLTTSNNTRLNALTKHSTLLVGNASRQRLQQQRLLSDRQGSATPPPPPPSSVSALREDGAEDHLATTKASAAAALAIDSTNDKNGTVHFGRVHIRQFGISISENPCVSEGPPIELGWDFREQPEPLSVDQYEAIRLPRRRRRLQEFLLSDRERRRMLLGRYTHQDIKKCIRQVEQIKRQRVLTYLMLPASAFDEAAEDMYRYVTRSFK